MPSHSLPLALSLVALLSACAAPDVYATSGREFLAARSGAIDPEIAAAAVGEPDLRFPARIGIARLVGNSLTTPPEAEAAAIAGFQARAAGFGSFQWINPMIARTLTGEVPRTGLRLAQLTAARQHLDYVLIYDLDRQETPSGAKGVAQTVLMDVRTGYVYGAVSAQAPVTGLGRTRIGWRNFALSDAAALKVVEALIPQVAEMFRLLADEAA